MKRILISLGGNALGTDFSSLNRTSAAVAAPIADLIAEGSEVLVCHGNGPQVGIINAGLEIGLEQTGEPVLPLSEAVAMSQSFIGYHLQNAIKNRLLTKYGIVKQVVTIVTCVEVDPADERFSQPTKPVGSFKTKEQAEALEALGKTVIEDSGRGYREVVASPLPLKILESEAVNTLIDSGAVVIAGGGGGIPVFRDAEGQIQAIDAVIDKDWVSVMLAADTDCSSLVILTGVEKVAYHFNQADQAWMDQLTVSEARSWMESGEFAAGSMLPKIEAAIQFTTSAPDRRTLITSLERLNEGLAGETGTWLVNG